MFTANNAMLNSDNINTILDHLKPTNKNPYKYIFVYKILVDGLKKMDSETTHPNIFAAHKSHVKSAVEMLTNDERIQSKQKHDDSDEENMLSIENYLKERLKDTKESSTAKETIQKCLDTIEQYVQYHDQLCGKQPVNKRDAYIEIDPAEYTTEYESLPLFYNQNKESEKEAEEEQSCCRCSIQ